MKQEGMGNKTREVELGAELLHLIQSRLPIEEAARTSVLSKSWLHAWSTIPTLRFPVRKAEETKNMKLVVVDRTLTRYLRDNIPIETFELKISIINQESASYAEKLIQPVVTKTSLKEFSLVVSYIDSDPDSDIIFTLPDEILLGENLTKLRVIRSSRGGNHALWMTTSLHPVIKCVSLQELHLYNVHISEETLHHILSSCSLLVKIELLHSCTGFKTIRVKNLARLYGLAILLDDRQSPALEISDVPNLGMFSYCHFAGPKWLGDGLHPLAFNANVHSISLGSSVTELTLQGVVPGNACLDMIKSGFPSLESLTLYLSTWIFESFDFTCASLKRLSLQSCPGMLTDVQVHAPKLLFFSFHSDEVLPNLLFPVSTLEKIRVSLQLRRPVGASFFVKMRQAVTLSRECDLHITIPDYSKLTFDIDIEDLRTRLLFPSAMNVQKLSFGTGKDECLWERSPFFDALFEICHPMHIRARPDQRFRHNNHFGRVMLREVLEKNNTTTETVYWPQYLKHVEISLPSVQTWETLSNSHRSFLDGSARSVPLDFKLEWR